MLGLLFTWCLLMEKSELKPSDIKDEILQAFEPSYADFKELLKALQSKDILFLVPN